MPNFELSISPNYVADWALLHAVREIFQNALDQQTVDPSNKILFDYNPHLQLLKIGNKSSNLCPSTLVLGNTTKANDNRTIGQFGEGYKLALVVLLRLGKSVTIYNNPDVWTPTIVMSSNFKTPVLNINTVKYRFKTLPEQDLVFTIAGVTPEEFEQIKDSNLYFHDDTEHLISDYGRILLDPVYKGKIFVSGLYITALDRAEFGYDFKPGRVDIGRDRNLVNEWDIFWSTSFMWAGQEGHAQIVDDLIKRKAADVNSIQHHIYKMPKHTIEVIGGGWYRSNVGATPCTTESEAQKARQLHGEGTKTVIVSEQLMAILKASVEYKEVAVKQITNLPPAELVTRVCKHLDRFKPSMRNDIKALMEMSKYWGWIK